MAKTYQIRMHGIGGQGVAACADLLGLAAVKDNRFAHSFPFFGTEIRGGIVSAYTRISDQPIRTRSFIYSPDLVVVFAAFLVTPEVLAGLEADSLLLINGSPSREELPQNPCGKVVYIDGDSISSSVGGRMANGPLLGAIAALTRQVSLTSLEEAITERFPQEVACVMVQATRIGYEQNNGKSG